MTVARQLDIPAVNFWYWEGCRRYRILNLVRDLNMDSKTTLKDGRNKLPGKICPGNELKGSGESAQLIFG